MAKGKYKKWIEPENLLLLSAWARDGLSDEQLAEKMGIAPSTLYAWKNDHVEISEALKKGKEVADIEVENALYKKALGYNVMLKKTFKVKTVDYDDNGRRIRETEELVTAFDEMHVPPDTGAQVFWLKNRKPDVWRDKQDIEHSGKIDGSNPLNNLTEAQLRALADVELQSRPTNSNC